MRHAPLPRCRPSRSVQMPPRVNEEGVGAEEEGAEVGVARGKEEAAECREVSGCDYVVCIIWSVCIPVRLGRWRGW